MPPLCCSTSHSIVTLRGPGEFISEISLLQGDFGVWQTNVVARTDVQALLLTKHDVKNMLRDRPEAEADVRAGGPCLNGAMWQNWRLGGVTAQLSGNTSLPMLHLGRSVVPVLTSTEGFIRAPRSACAQCAAQAASGEGCCKHTVQMRAHTQSISCRLHGSGCRLGNQPDCNVLPVCSHGPAAKRVAEAADLGEDCRL